MEKRDVVIVGAGPSGLKAAEILAKNGRDVLILEKNNIIGPKVCAAGLTAKDENLVDKEVIERTFSSVIVASKNQRIRISNDKPFVYTTTRYKLGQWQLKQAEKAGAEIRTNSAVSSIKNNSVIVDNNEIKFNYLIGADGSGSIVRRHLGLKNDRVHMAIQYIIEQEFEDMELIVNGSLFSYGYAWVFPYEKSASVGCGADLRHIKTMQLKENLHKWMEERKINYKNGVFEAFIINYDYRGFQFGNKFLVGDAAGFTSGLSGEGIYSAILSGHEVAKKIIDKDYGLGELNKYLKLKRRHERILNFLERSQKLTNLKQEILVFLLRSKFFSRKALQLVT